MLPGVSDETPADGFAHTLLLRRSVTDPGEVTYFLAHAPDMSPGATLIPMVVDRRMSGCGEGFGG